MSGERFRTIMVLVMFLAAVALMVVIINEVDMSKALPVANFYGNNTLGVTCTHGSPYVSRIGEEIVVKCK